MDNLAQIQEKFLICPLCDKRYTNPKLLPCLHTFCGLCLSDNVKEQIAHDFEENGVGDSTSGQIYTIGFKCPVCHANTRQEVSDVMGRDEISSSFTDNHLVATLIEKIDVHTNSSEKTCESCSRLAQGQGHRAAKAEVWCQNCKIAFCESCIKAHNVIKACREHIVISLKDMKVNPLQSIRNAKREVPCKIHKDRILEFYCHDCSETICSSCAAVQHRKCELVDTCAESVHRMKPETENVLKDLDAQEHALKDWQTEHKKEISELETNRQGLIKEIKSVRMNIDRHLATLEQSALQILDTKHEMAVEDVKDRLKEVEGLKKNLENTHQFLKAIVSFGSDSELLSVFDKVRQQADEMRAGMHRRRISKLFVRHKFSLDPNLSRLIELSTMGKIVDVVDMNKDEFPMNGENGHSPLSPLSPVRRSSVKRTGTFRVDKNGDGPQETQNQHPSTLSNLSTPSPSNSSDSMSSQEFITPDARSMSIRRQQAASARLTAGSTTSLQRPKRVYSTMEPRRNQTPTPSRVSKTPPVQRRSMSSCRSPAPAPREKHTPEEKPKTTPRMERKSTTSAETTPRIERRHRPEKVATSATAASTAAPVHVGPPPIKPRHDRHTVTAVEKLSSPPSSLVHLEKLDKLPATHAQLLCSFNGRTETDAKKCWPLDVAVLCDGTPVVTDFHNKKIKAFDASGTVMCDVLLPSWPHGISDVAKNDVAVTLPEISTIVFVSVQEGSMSMRKRIKTVKQYRGICCHAYEDENNPSIIVSCCASNSQSVDVLSLEGEVLHSYRNDNRLAGRTLFTWPYYVTTNGEGEIIVSDCETKTGLLYLDTKGDVKHDCLSIGVVIQDPRGICTDIEGNVYLADKSAHVIHSLTPDGRYRKCVVNAKDGLLQPIAVCVSPFGHIIVTQDNGDVKVYAFD